MEGQLIVKAWKAWKGTGEGSKALNPYTLGLGTPLLEKYLHNRLETAFQAGIAAAEKVAERSEVVAFNAEFEARHK